MRLWILVAFVACTGRDDAGDIDVSTDSRDTSEASTQTFGPPADAGPRVAPPLELCINEFMPWNVRSWDDGSKSWPDWIELHNPGSKPISLAGWSLTDDRDDPKKHTIASNLLVEPGEFLILVADGEPDRGPAHLSFSLDRSGEEVALFRPDGSGEIIAFGAVVGDLSVARATDCGAIDDWVHVSGGTPGASNEASE